MNAIGKLWSGTLAALFALTGFAALSDPPSAPQTNEADTQFFETKIRPLLVEKCQSCHGAEQQKGGVRLDSRSHLLSDGNNGPAVVAGAPDGSPLLRAVRYTGAIKMPPTGKLSNAEIAALEQWITRGAVWPETKKKEEPAGKSGSSGKYIIPPEKKNFWAFRPVRKPALPKVKKAAWVKNPIDAFILAGLEKKGLKPAPPADKRTLIRRATFDLTGLPPTPEEIGAFLADKSPNAFAKVVDRLLASPAYGERWGRHWLDVVRYADSLDARGLGSEGDISEAWRYRDWVVDALNRDMPYSLFMMNQVAGDLLPNANAATLTNLKSKIQNPKSDDLNIPGTISTGMLAIGNWGNGDADKEKILTDIADDQVDVVSRAFMGLTIACARCHDHKFDPISTKDYYGMAGIFFSTHILPKLTPKGAGETPLRIPLISKAEQERRGQIQTQIAALEKQEKETATAQFSAFVKSMLPQTAHYVTAAWEYRRRPAAQSGLSLTDFATQQGLYPYALRQWMDFLGMNDYRLMRQSVRSPFNNPDLTFWKGDPDTPSLTINAGKEVARFITITMPPHSIAVHPGPTTGVAVGWKSPVSGTFRITGKVADADPNCGDGIAWVVQKQTAGGSRELASGDIPNGGAQDFTQGQNAAQLNAVEVKAGENVNLLILPKNGHACDTTVVELTLTEIGGKHAWSLTHDLMDDPAQGNPHRDSLGNASVWHYYDMASGAPRPTDPKIAAALTAWQQAAAEADTALQSQTPNPKSKIERAAEQFQQAFTPTDASNPFWINSRNDESVLPQEARTALAKLHSDLDTLRKIPMPPPQYANGAQEGGCPESPQAGVHDVRVHIRGSYLRLGDLVPRHFPVVLAGENQPPITQGSGRLELARWLASDTHQLTPRVLVNRLWQHHFGQGIVRTPSNFGWLGERPTHPELLDWLASNFVKNGWSLKKMHRTILLSATYQQASTASAQAMKLDPDNRLFGRMNRRRLEAEALRDNLLAVSGKLDRTMGGVAVRDFNSPRRTLYIMTIRSDRTGFGPLFDTADSTASVDKRATSTVAPQALFLLNNPFLLEQTKALTQRLMNEVPNDDRARIQRAYALLYGRPTAEAEIRIGLNFLTRARKTVTVQVAGPGAANTDLLAWQEYAQILLCANEFLYID